MGEEGVGTISEQGGSWQVNAATKLKAKAGMLQEQATTLLGQATEEKTSAEGLKAQYYTKMDEYSDAVKDIDAATANAQSILDQMNAQSLVLAQVATQYGMATNHGKNPDAAAAVALKAQLLQAQKDLQTITAKKAQVSSRFSCRLGSRAARLPMVLRLIRLTR